MFKRISHIGIVVDNLDETLNMFRSIFGLQPTIVKDAMEGKMRVAFIHLGDGELELLQPIDPSIPIERFPQIQNKGIHHISFSTNNILSEIERMKRKGIAFINEEPKIGAHGVKIVFTKPETTGNIVVEICEEKET